MLKKMTAALMLTILVMTTMMPVTVSAYGTCSENGCDRSPNSGEWYCRLHKCGQSGCHSRKGGNGTIYCDTHARSYSATTYPTSICSAVGCYARAGSGLYCYNHTCIKGGCTNKRVGDSSYCSLHGGKTTTTSSTSSTTYKKTTGLTGKYGSTSSISKSGKSTTTSSSTKKSIPSVVKKSDPYNVYDYDDPEDFYYDNEDDFEDYEDAEDYFDEAWGY